MGKNMDQLLQIRQNLITAYKRNESKAELVLKFLAGVLIFWRISSLAGGAGGIGRTLLITLALGVLTAVVSSSVFLLLAVAAVGYYLFLLSVETAILVVLVLLVMYLFYGRLFPTETLLIPALLLGYYFKVPYAVVIFAGIYAGMRAVVPIACGVFLWSFAPYLPQLVEMSPKAAFTPLGMPDAFLDIYIKACEILEVETQWMLVAGIFVVAALVAYGISRLSRAFAKEIAILAAGLVMLFSYIFAVLFGRIDANMILVFLSIAISIVLVEGIKFFEIVLDYQGTEQVQFEDDYNYYYVKVVPKVLLAAEGSRQGKSRRGGGKHAAYPSKTGNKTPNLEYNSKGRR